VRPDCVLLGADAEDAGVNVMRATIQDHTYQGPFIRYRLDLGGQTVIAEATNRADRAVLDNRAEVAVAWRPKDSEILPD